MNNNYKAIVRINNDRDNAPTNPHFANPALYLHLIEDAGNNSNDNKNGNNNHNKNINNNTTTTQQWWQHQTERKIQRSPSYQLGLFPTLSWRSGTRKVYCWRQKDHAPKMDMKHLEENFI